MKGIFVWPLLILLCLEVRLCQRPIAPRSGFLQNNFKPSTESTTTQYQPQASSYQKLGVLLQKYPLLAANPFLKTLAGRGIVLDEVTKYPATSCGLEWENFGSVCDKDLLAKYATEESKIILAAVDDVSAKLQELSKSLLDLRGSTVSSTTMSNKFSKFKNTWGIPTNKEFVKEVQLFAENPAQFTNELKKCWEPMSKVRSGSLCDICSARSQVFFTANRILMGQDGCLSLLETCTPSFSTLISFLSKLEKFLEPLVEPNAEKSSTQPEYEIQLESTVNQLIRFKHSMSSHHIKQLISQFLEAKNHVKMTVSAKLCAELIRVFKTPFVEEVASFLKPATRAIFLRSESYVKLPRIIHRPQNNRRLQSGGPVLDMSIGGDVLMVPSNIDSSYNAFLGATGTTVMVPVGSKPLNITNSFP